VIALATHLSVKVRDVKELTSLARALKGLQKRLKLCITLEGGFYIEKELCDLLLTTFMYAHLYDGLHSPNVDLELCLESF
jgi:hypothetical protein